MLIKSILNFKIISPIQKIKKDSPPLSMVTLALPVNLGTTDISVILSLPESQQGMLLHPFHPTHKTSQVPLTLGPYFPSESFILGRNPRLQETDAALRTTRKQRKLYC